MAESVTGASKPARPTITVPPRESMEPLFLGGSGIGLSSGPMTMVSSFFGEQSPFSFTQLVAGAMSSSMLRHVDPGNEKEDAAVGYKKNRPESLVVAQQPPLFMLPPGLSPSALLNSPGFLSTPLPSPLGMSHQQALAHVTAQAAVSQAYVQMQTDDPSSRSDAGTVAKSCSSVLESLSAEPESLKLESSDSKSSFIPGSKLATDGYYWRKYGQKHVKAGACPRSYYKCTHLNCPVKKVVERSAHGHITEITYKGQHNHDPPPLNKRGKDSTSDRTADSREKLDFPFSQDHHGSSRFSKRVAVRPEQENFQTTAAINGDTVDHDAVVSDAEDGQIAKRRNTHTMSSHQTVTESKIVVQTRSEVDLLDDGYRWRKYGPKVVKGNPHPRSYYRCTYSGCPVRKYVERASADPKAVIATYEGKHDHEIPTGKFIAV